MTYRALYREWRPRFFNDIVGQQHIVLTLENALKNNRIAHAYLFCGPRGTGKTSTAKVLSKALNCFNLQGSEPCNKCDSCLTISSGSSIDVIEIDAASNRGIDEIRDLKEKVKFYPSKGKYKIYIVDEVHMLTNEAFNALLKTIEEPPNHVIFILATTEPQKVPLTILSRCQRFDFKAIALKDIVNRLEDVLQYLNIVIESSALYKIAAAAEGGLRDALSILDQIVTFGNKDKISEEDVHNLLGTVNRDVMNKVLEFIYNGDISSVLHVISKIASDGKDPYLFIKEFTSHTRGFLLTNIAPTLASKENILDYSKDNSFENEFLLSVLDCLTQHETKIKWSSQPRIILELAFVKLIKNQVKLNPNFVLDNTDKDINKHKEYNNKVIKKKNKEIEKNKDEVKLAKDEITSLNKNNLTKDTLTDDLVIKRDKAGYEVKQVEPVVEEKSTDISLKRVKQAWEDIVKEIKQVKSAISRPMFKSVPLKLENKILTIGLEDDFYRKWLDNNQKNKDLIQQAIKSILGFNCQVRFENAKIKDFDEQVQNDDKVNTSQSIINLFEAKEIKN